MPEEECLKDTHHCSPLSCWGVGGWKLICNELLNGFLSTCLVSPWKHVNSSIREAVLDNLHDVWEVIYKTPCCSAVWRADFSCSELTGFDAPSFFCCYRQWTLGPCPLCPCLSWVCSYVLAWVKFLPNWEVLMHLVDPCIGVVLCKLLPIHVWCKIVVPLVMSTSGKSATVENFSLRVRSWSPQTLRA